MPPKKGAAAKGAASATGGKKAKVTLEPEDAELKATGEALKTADNSKKTVHQVDPYVTLSGVSVYSDYDCMLNQTNIEQNMNKFYAIQLLTGGSNSYHVFTRYGRVGEQGRNDCKNFSDVKTAIKEFCKKFSDKTKNQWDNRANFTLVPKSYALIELEQGDAKEIPQTVQKQLHAPNDTEIVTAPPSLDKTTQEFEKLTLDNNVPEEQMANFEHDAKKMPLGKLSEAQIAKGFDILEEIQNALDARSPVANLRDLSSKFYTVIPHSFGRKQPPIINSAEALQAERDKLLKSKDS